MVSRPLPEKTLPEDVATLEQSDLSLRLCVRDDEHALALCVARILVARCARAVAERGVFTLALSGGRTPLSLFRLLRTPAWKDQLDWPCTRVFWVDERCVPLDHPDSNAGAALRELLEAVPVGEIYRMQGEAVPVQAARAYGQTLREHCDSGEQGIPRFDCILLGMGTDGHTASLFPGSPLLHETVRLVASCLGPDGKTQRLTLTLPVLNAARCCLFMVSGAEKCEPLAACLAVLAKPLFPAQRVRPHAGELIWVVEKGTVRVDAF